MILHQQIDEAIRVLGEVKSYEPRVGIILGTGLGGLAEKLEDSHKKSYSDIPGMSASDLEGHSSQLWWGQLGSTKVVCMEGRMHYYEGYTLDQITYPIRLMKALGVEILIVSNAAGGLNPQYEQGDLVLIEDHINLMGVSPLIGKNDETLGPRFPDMIEPYSHELLSIAEGCALRKGVKTHRGVYAAVTGPQLETRAEYRYMRMLGSDLVGMSTVPEVIVAVHSGLKVLGLSCVTDLCLPDALKPVNIQEIIDVANRTAPIMCDLVTDFLETFHK